MDYPRRRYGDVEKKTITGRFTIRFVRLDRQRLNDLRRFLYTYQKKVAALETELQRRNLDAERRAVLSAHLADIKPLVSPPVYER